MTAEDDMSRKHMLPHLIEEGLLSEAERRALFDLVMADRAGFASGDLRGGKRHTVKRVAQIMAVPPPFQSVLRERLLARVPGWAAALGMGRLEVGEIELQCAAHGDGAFYRPHIDIETGDKSRPSRWRALSIVYYVHGPESGFTGGALRFHGFMSGGERPFVDIEPRSGRMVIFPSFAPHEVRPVSCPSGDAADWRMAINCWVQRCCTGDGQEA